jgi:hypothetical protein
MALSKKDEREIIDLLCETHDVGTVLVFMQALATRKISKGLRSALKSIVKSYESI